MSPALLLNESACIEKRRICKELTATLHAMREIAAREIWTPTTGGMTEIDQLVAETKLSVKRKNALMLGI